MGELVAVNPRDIEADGNVPAETKRPLGALKSKDRVSGACGKDRCKGKERRLEVCRGHLGANTFTGDRQSPPNLPSVSLFRNRVYDQRSGRWTQEDPIGLAGDLNLFRFNGNNPSLYSDPFGLQGCRDPRDMICALAVQVSDRTRGLQEAVTLALGIQLAPLAIVAGGEALAGGMLGRIALAAPVAGATPRVIGHFPEYLATGQRIGAKVFDVPSRIFAALSRGEQWAANQKFLDRGIRDGADFILATERGAIRFGSALAREVEYLLSHGYKWSADNSRLIPQ